MPPFLGPPLSHGSLPAIFYFALSAEDSLHLDPYNQPAVALKHLPLRVFSVTLPFHHLPPEEAISCWAEEFDQGRDPITPFAQTIVQEMESLIQQNIIDKEHVGVMGLSRGAFIAAHVAAKASYVRSILGFAPLTKWRESKTFKTCGADHLDLLHLAPHLFNRTLRFYCGNHDTRVSTAACFEFISHLAQTAYRHHIRTSPLELRIGPSRGKDGHGTSPEIFQEGALWLAQNI